MSALARLAGVAVLGLALLAALALGPCDGDEDAPATTPTATTATPTPTPTPTAAELLEAAAERMEEVDSFRFELEHENGATEIVRGIAMESAEGAVAGQDSMDAEIRARAGPVNARIRVIILPDQSWMTNPLTGRWERSDLSLGSLFDPARGVTGLMRDVTGAERAGEERIDGARTVIVEARIESGKLARFVPGAASGREVPARAWIGVDDPVVHRVELIGPVTDADPDDIVRRLSLRDFDSEIQIEPPR